MGSVDNTVASTARGTAAGLAVAASVSDWIVAALLAETTLWASEHIQAPTLNEALPCREPKLCEALAMPEGRIKQPLVIARGTCGNPHWPQDSPANLLLRRFASRPSEVVNPSQAVRIDRNL